MDEDEDAGSECDHPEDVGERGICLSSMNSMTLYVLRSLLNHRHEAVCECLGIAEQTRRKHGEKR